MPLLRVAPLDVTGPLQVFDFANRLTKHNARQTNSTSCATSIAAALLKVMMSCDAPPL